MSVRRLSSFASLLLLAACGGGDEGAAGAPAGGGDLASDLASPTPAPSASPTRTAERVYSCDGGEKVSVAFLSDGTSADLTSRGRVVRVEAAVPGAAMLGGGWSFRGYPTDARVRIASPDRALSNCVAEAAEAKSTKGARS